MDKKITKDFVDIKGYEGIYKINKEGEVYSLKSKKKMKNYQLKQRNNLTYIYIGLYKHRKQKKFGIHRLLAQAFIDNTENKKEVNHINGIKWDNRLENLEWVTQSENVQHAYKTGLHYKSEGKTLMRNIKKETKKNIKSVCNNILNETFLKHIIIREMFDNGKTIYEISNILGLKYHSVYRTAIRDRNIKIYNT